MGSRVITVAVVASIVACGAKPPAQPAPPENEKSLTAIVDSMRLAWNMPAMGVAIVTLDEGVTGVAVAGTRRAVGGAPVTVNDLWHLGSNTKAATSLLAAVAVSQQRILWTTTIAEAFPDLTNIRSEYREVTLRDLLSHQSGFPRDGSGFASGTTPPAQRELAVAWGVQQPPIVTRGTYSYSNLGYVIASVMLERAFGTTYEAAMATHIFGPLNMNDVGWGPQAAPGSNTQPVAHLLDQGGAWVVFEGYDNPPVYNSSGRAHMSLASWGRLIHEVLRVEAGTSTLAPAAVAQQTTSAVVSVDAAATYGMGWVISTRPWANGKVLFHDGSNGANHSLVFVAPVRKVAYLVNTNGYDPAGRSLQALSAMITRLDQYHSKLGQ